MLRGYEHVMQQVTRFCAHRTACCEGMSTTHSRLRGYAQHTTRCKVMGPSRDPQTCYEPCQGPLCKQDTSPSKHPSRPPSSPAPCATDHRFQGYPAHKKPPPPLGSPQGPRHGATVGSHGGGIIMTEVPLYEPFHEPLLAAVHAHPQQVTNPCATYTRSCTRD